MLPLNDLKKLATLQYDTRAEGQSLAGLKVQ